MNNFAALYRYEWKKLWQKKLVWIMFLLLAVTIGFSCCADLFGAYYVEGVAVDTHYHMFVTDTAYAKALSGRAIGQALLEETITAYRKIPENSGTNYSLTEEYQRYARPYSAIFNFIKNTTPMQSSEVRLNWEPNEQDLYDQRQLYLMEGMGSHRLTEGEIQFWQAQEAQIPKPLTYEYHEGYNKLLSIFQTVAVMELLFVSIALSGIFFDEHTRKTDQIILACPLGKGKLYWAKIGAGLSLSVLSAVLLSAIAFLTVFLLHGTEGFGAAFQLMYTRNSSPITCGQAIFIAYGCLVVSAAAVGIFVMVLSELLHSNMAALTMSVGMVFLSMILNIPEQYRVLSQIWDWLPWCFLGPWNVFGCYTLPVFGHYLVSWQAVPLLCLGAGIAMAFAGRACYRRYQVSGR